MVENSFCFIVEMINYLYISCLIRKDSSKQNMKIFKRVLGDSGSEIIHSTFTLLLYFKKNI